MSVTRATLIFEVGVFPPVVGVLPPPPVVLPHAVSSSVNTVRNAARRARPLFFRIYASFLLSPNKQIQRFSRIAQASSCTECQNHPQIRLGVVFHCKLHFIQYT